MCKALLVAKAVGLNSSLSDKGKVFLALISNQILKHLPNPVKSLERNYLIRPILMLSGLLGTKLGYILDKQLVIVH